MVYSLYKVSILPVKISFKRCSFLLDCYFDIIFNETLYVLLEKIMPSNQFHVSSFRYQHDNFFFKRYSSTAAAEDNALLIAVLVFLQNFLFLQHWQLSVLRSSAPDSTVCNLLKMYYACCSSGLSSKQKPTKQTKQDNFMSPKWILCHLVFLFAYPSVGSSNKIKMKNYSKVWTEKVMHTSRMKSFQIAPKSILLYFLNGS